MTSRLSSTRSKSSSKTSGTPRLNTPSLDSPSRKTSTLNDNDYGTSTSRRSIRESSPLDGRSDIIENNLLEKQLFDKGYVVKEKFMIKNGNLSRAEYLKAVNKNGQDVIIQIDTEGELVTVDKNDLTVVRSSEINTIPYSVSMGAVECAEGLTCGVALECNNGICTLSRDSKSLEVMADNMIYVSGKEEKNMSFNGDYMTYPVVFLSEIRSNNDLVVKNTDIVTRRLRNKAYEECQSDINLLENEVTQMMELLKSFKRQNAEIANKMRKTMQDLEALNAKYLETPPQSEENKKKYELVQKNIRIRNEMTPKFLNMCRDISNNRNEISKINAVLREVSNDMSIVFKNIDKVIA